MFSVSLYIIFCSFKNRFRLRIRRMREPRYLVGALAGAAYLWFSFFARLFRPSPSSARRAVQRSPATTQSALAALGAAGPAIAGIVLLAVTAISWVFPFESLLFEFSDPEIQFLFPAPISRRQLLLYRLMRSQMGLLFTALVTGIVRPAGSWGGRLMTAVAMWVLMVTAKVYFTGITLARSRLASASARSRRTAWLPALTLGLALAIVIRAFTAGYSAHPPVHVSDALTLVRSVSESGLASVVLWPFMALVSPLFSAWPGPYLMALMWSALVLAAVVIWVLTIDTAFYESAASETAERRAMTSTPKRQSKYRRRSGGWPLAPAGRPEMAFAWKSAMQMLRVADRVTIIRIGALLFALTMMGMSIGRTNGIAAIIGVIAFGGIAFSILLAPQVIRADLRQDLGHLELLKTWPVAAGAIVRGEMAWPGAAITIVAWVMTAIAFTQLSPSVFNASLSLAWRAAIALAIVILAPALVFAQLTIHNAVALLLPAWVPLGSQRQRGLDAMGQRLIMLGGTWLLLIVMLLPGALAGAIVWFVFSRFAGPAAILPAALLCTIIVFFEVLAATEALGPAYERLDLLAVERGE